ncbi:UPF0182 family protein [Streptantibioticus parmotrematis]|uniref:UPF0182 family membrane protein n=1 Tax=Streptantibioticus parmotrematis TaxID=2873249 RepID=UPI00340B992A
MPDREEGPTGPASAVGGTSRRVRALFVTLGALAVLGMAFVMFSGFWTDWLWYRSVRFTSVFTVTCRARLGLFTVFGLVMAVAVGLNVHLAHRLRPPLGAMSAEQESLDRYRLGIAPFRTWLLVAVCAVVGLIAGASAAGQWRTWLLYEHAVPFGTKDPRFGLDVSFYTFDLPWYRFLLGFGFAAVLLCLMVSALTHYLYGGLRLTTPGGARATAAATGHLSVLMGLFLSLKAVAYWLDRYGLAVKGGGFAAVPGWSGLRYVDADAYLPAKTILCCIAIICALLFFATLWRRTWSLPVLGLGLMALSAILIGGLYPAIVQKFQVQPDEAAKEAPYLQKNIDATRAAYGIATTKETAYPGTAASSVSATKLRADAAGAADVPLLDPDLTAPAFQQAQAGRGPYAFDSPLSVGRTPASGGTERETVVGVRELNPDAMPRDDWVDDHLRYTHGYGLVTADADTTTDTGAPVFTAGGTGADTLAQPRVYYGEQTTQYAIVGGPTPELDETAGPGGKGYHYTGGSGVSLADPLTRAAYAIQLGQPRLLYSDVDKNSRILYDRTPQQRVRAVAPWLTVDGDPYPAVVGGHLEWIVDGYTTSDDYPYSSRTTLGDPAADGDDSDGTTAASGGQVDYVRDAVKATVDAYTGQVRLYQWDTTDPVLKTWMRAYPGTVEPKSAIPADLVSHLRYPTDLFTAQRQMLTRYHVTDAADFFSGDQELRVPDDPAKKGSGGIQPTYLDVRLPGSTTQRYSLTSPLTPAGRTTLGGYLAVDSDATSPGYGTLTLLRTPAGGAGPGPAQVHDRLTTDTGIAAQIGALRRGGSDVEYGEQVAVPLDGGMLYAEPVYVRGAGADAALLKKVLVAYGNRTALDDTLGRSLDDLFGTTTSGTPPPAATGASQAVRQALADAQRAYDAGQKALKAGDWTAYGTAQRQLGEALRRASGAASDTGTPAPTS